MDYDIFKNEDERKQARQALADLQEHPGWKFILRALAANVQHFSQELMDNPDFENVDQVRYLQTRIKDLQKFQELPQLLLHSLIPDLEPEEEDIYQA